MSEIHFAKELNPPEAELEKIHGWLDEVYGEDGFELDPEMDLPPQTAAINEADRTILEDAKAGLRLTRDGVRILGAVAAQTFHMTKDFLF